jgi:hypothetical protein
VRAVKPKVIVAGLLALALALLSFACWRASDAAARSGAVIDRKPAALVAPATRSPAPPSPRPVAPADPEAPTPPAPEPPVPPHPRLTAGEFAQQYADALCACADLACAEDVRLEYNGRAGEVSPGRDGEVEHTAFDRGLACRARLRAAAADGVSSE